MADADEDVIPRLGASGGEDVDLSDETQDFRFLTNISREDSLLPKRGEKDFEPHATALQLNTLTASRQAMQTALSYQRVHPTRTHVVGFYHPEAHMAYVVDARGSVLPKFGSVLGAEEDPLGGDGKARGRRLWLLPEEVVYLVERGSLDLRWPVVEDDGEDDDEEREDGKDGVRDELHDDQNGHDDNPDQKKQKLGLSMSMQAAYAIFIGDHGAGTKGGALSLDRYTVYANLKRMGYHVVRAPSWDNPGDPIGNECYPPPPSFSPTTWQTGLLNIPSLLARFFFSTPNYSSSTSPPSPHERNGPLIQPGIYRDYASIYRKLALIPHYNPITQHPPPTPVLPTTDPLFRVTFHVWKPSTTTFKKSAPTNPDFRIAVLNAQDTAVPTLTQLSALMTTVPYDPPATQPGGGGGQLYQRLKRGYKHVTLAVVDQGVISYMRVADAAFGEERLYERTARGPGAKRGGGGGRGGRGGRGRGRR